MKNLLLIIPILFFLNITEIKVISYNIRYNNSNDGINIWENRIFPNVPSAKLYIFSGHSTYGKFGEKHSLKINRILLKAKKLKIGLDPTIVKRSDIFIFLVKHKKVRNIYEYAKKNKKIIIDPLSEL